MQRRGQARGFLLQVDAANPADLPLERQAFGYEDLDFDFAGNGVDSGRRLYWHGAVQLLPGACMVTASLPAYEIAAVRTGQYSDSGEPGTPGWSSSRRTRCSRRRREMTSGPIRARTVRIHPI